MSQQHNRVRAVPFKSVVRRRNGSFFEGGGAEY